jgi:NAD(P) transhydrogenase subunit alpha
MKIAVPLETAPGETRVALTPQAVVALLADGVDVVVQSGAGDSSFISDEAFREAGASIVPDAAALYGEADVVVRVGRPAHEETGKLRKGAIIKWTVSYKKKTAHQTEK